MKKLISWSELENLLIKLGEELKQPVQLVVIGSTVCMSLGQADRMTSDVDVWRNSSVFDLGVLKSACQSSGIDFNPTAYDEPENAYIQLIDPGIVQLGIFKETEVIFKTGNLELRRPPIENIIASKLVRGDAQDFDDCVFLMNKCKISIDKISDAIDSISDLFSKENAKENISLLITCSQSSIEIKRLNSEIPRG